MHQIRERRVGFLQPFAYDFDAEFIDVFVNAAKETLFKYRVEIVCRYSTRIGDVLRRDLFRKMVVNEINRGINSTFPRIGILLVIGRANGKE